MARELAPAGQRSGPKNLAGAAHPSGSKLPRHNSLHWLRLGTPPIKIRPRRFNRLRDFKVADPVGPSLIFKQMVRFSGLKQVVF